VLALLASVLLWTGAGNTFAAHLGAVTHSEARPSSVDGGGPARHGETSSALNVRQGPVPHDVETSHVLHLLGGCIAVLGAALVLGAGAFSRVRPVLGDTGAAGRVVPGRAARSRWWPPPLSPPTTSPVLRT